MNSVLTRPQSLQELYKTYFSFASRFKFTDLLRNYIQNEEWKDKSQEPIWEVLSKISDDIGAVLTDEIVNYTRNVVDVNTCKVPELIEHGNMLSYRLDHFRNIYAFFPERIQCLVDLFSINPEYLIGNSKNHILSDEVIKEILIYIRNNCRNRTPFTNEDVIDRLLDDPHGLLDEGTYRNFIVTLFFTTIVEALSAKYNSGLNSGEDDQPIAFNILYKERKNQANVLSRIDEWRTWLDKYISNEQDHQWNIDEKMGMSSMVETVKKQKRISTKFNPFAIADHIFFNGLNPDHGLSEDELDLVEQVIDYHSKTKYDYENNVFVDDASTKYAYYREIELCQYLKFVMFVMNNLNSFNSELTYEVSSNKFLQLATDGSECLRVVQIFCEDGQYVVENLSNGKVALNYGVILKVAKFLEKYAHHIQMIRENMKTIAQKHAMRGTGALLVHMVNDYLVKELPYIRDTLVEAEPDKDIRDLARRQLRFSWEYDSRFRNYGNVEVLEYEDDNEYFNIEPTGDVRFTERTNARYWEALSGIGADEGLGVFTKNQIREFYSDVLGMGRLQPKKPRDYDDIQDFLVDLFKIGANPVSRKDGQFNNPIDDIINKSEEDYGYEKWERVEVQQNTELRRNQERQFLEYFGDEQDDFIGQGIYDYMNNRLFYWKNRDYASHVLHPFMYNLKLWNRLNNIIVNGYKDYVDTDLIDFMSSKVKFDELFGKYGEARNFWKYNVMDLTGYTTRYEAAIKDEHLDDGRNTVSRLTGYDGLFYPDAVLEFMNLASDSSQDHQLTDAFFNGGIRIDNVLLKDGTVSRLDGAFAHGGQEFLAAIYSIYWQTETTTFVRRESGVNSQSKAYSFVQADTADSFYVKWYSHLNYTRSEYQRIAMQLWYWRDRIVELATTEYPIAKYCLDVRGNSLILVSTFRPDEDETNQFLVDLQIQQNLVQDGADSTMRNGNAKVSFCDNSLIRPSEMWIRWKSNPIAVPAFDVWYDRETGDAAFDSRYRSQTNVELGQIRHMDKGCNDMFSVVLQKWRAEYDHVLNGGNRMPVFFDMEQSANVLALASWYVRSDVVDGVQQWNSDGTEKNVVQCGKNPVHILSLERVATQPSEYMWEKYVQDGNLDTMEIAKNWMFDRYQYCPANGSILIPLYGFSCSDGGADDFIQKAHARMYVVPAQTLKLANYATTPSLMRLDDVDIDLNLDGSSVFGGQVKVCRNTNAVFSVYNDNGMNKVKMAFLGTVVDAHSGSKFKVSSCDAKTRYEFDSQKVEDLSMLRGRYYRGGDVQWEGIPEGDRRYIDESVFNRQEWKKDGGTRESDDWESQYQRTYSRPKFNSYDSNDKYVFVVDFIPSVDNPVLFNNSIRGDGWHVESMFNIIGDAGFIPHFAHQSLVKYGDKDGKTDRDGGTAYTWRNPFLNGKDHMQFELLGLDDKGIGDAFKAMRNLVVDDLTDGCKTLICPSRFMDDIYRIWCCSRTVKSRFGDYPYDMYFENEYKDYVNPEQTFEPGQDSVVWKVENDIGSLFTVELPSDSEGEETQKYMEALDDYYISVLRAKDGEILNEKRYILPPTPVTRFIVQAESSDGFVKCNLSKWESANVRENHYSSTQVVFTGTQNPFDYDDNGERIYSRPQELQYGNGICGVSGIELKIDIVENEQEVGVWKDDFTVVYEDDGETRKKIKYKVKQLLPSVRFTKFHSDGSSLTDVIQNSRQKIDAGQIVVVLSHKNVDNIAKYHILSRMGNLYFYGSLPKNPDHGNTVQYSDFKVDKSIRLKKYSDSDEWFASAYSDEDGNPYLDFSLSDVYSKNDNGLPPYFVKDAKDGEWMLQQGRNYPQSGYQRLENGSWQFSDNPEMHADRMNTVGYSIPAKGDFTWAHKVRDLRPQRYLDYLYIKNGALAFKVSEESYSFADALSKIPPFYVDVHLRNKMDDLNDCQMMTDYSTFIHQSENPETVKDCMAFNPLAVNAVLKYGVEQRDGGGGTSDQPCVVCAENGKAIELDNISHATRLKLQLEDGEIDDCLKIYTNYERIDDGHGDWHYDLWFNIQNLFNSPFEYISSVTGQPNVLIIPDSYLYLTGDKFKEAGDHNVIDEDKVESIRKGGELSIYGQVKTYSNDNLQDVRTVKLFTYRVYNISDDKPKFLIEKTFDITKSTLNDVVKDKLKIEFSDVMWTVGVDSFATDSTICYESDQTGDVLCGNPEQTVCYNHRNVKNNVFRVLDKDIVVVQPLKICHDWRKDDDSRILSVSFDIVSDIMDFGAVPELCGYDVQNRTLRNWGDHSLPYYDHWSDRYMNLEINPVTNIPRLTLTWDSDCGFNFDTVYLRWRMPRGFRIMDTIDRLMGYAFSSTAENVVVKCNNEMNVPDIEVVKGHVVPRVESQGKMYLGMEHSTTMRRNGFVLKGLKDAVWSALQIALPQAITEQEIVDRATSNGGQ